MTQNNVQLQDGNGPLAGFRNQIINGDFRIWQRPYDTGTEYTINNGKYTTDRWRTGFLGTSVGFVRRSGQTPVGIGGSAALLSDTGRFGQGIELPLDRDDNSLVGQFVNGSVFTLSMYSQTAASTVTGLSPDIEWDVTPLGNSANVTVSAGTCTNFVEVQPADANGFIRYSSTCTIDTSLFDNTNHLCLTVALPNSANISVPGGTYFYAGVQFEPGPIATPFEHRPIGTELALCQRYYLNPSSLSIAMCTASSSSPRFGYAVFPSSMRTVPTVNSLNYSVAPTGNSITPGPYGCRFRADGIATSTNCSLQGFQADAEL